MFSHWYSEEDSSTDIDSDQDNSLKDLISTFDTLVIQLSTFQDDCLKSIMSQLLPPAQFLRTSSCFHEITRTISEIHKVQLKIKETLEK